MKWIPVSERKPPVGSNIMIWSPEGHAAEGEMNSAGEFIQYRWSTRVKATHWAEMDPGPGEQKTADQMFRKMGFLWLGDTDGSEEGSRIYQVPDCTEAVKVNKNYVDFYGPGMDSGLTAGADIILACCQLIREMEQENG